ncbi:hypothetical protein [Saccharopolyspora gloriosae]|uniref:hypothetical protein n=1 Tax=Saccharopolyspora gloriosae TaxID=455344 RepID=UPI001FB84564|nr:hypothetical protein [Saccharopolyspora gloriosae]
MEPIDSQSRGFDPDYFALTVRQAMRNEEFESGPYPGDYLEDVAGPDTDEVLFGEVAELGEHPDIVEVDERVTAAEIAVMTAEDAGRPDEVARRRLDRARQERRAVLVRLQKARTAVHTARSVSRVAQVLPLRPFRVVRGGEVA